MPSKSLTPEEKAKVTSAVPPSFNKIFAASVVPARIYFAHSQRDKWSYGGLVSFSKHELYHPFEYHKDRPFFRSFAGDVRSSSDRCRFRRREGCNVTTRNAKKATKVPSEPERVKKERKTDRSMLSGPTKGSLKRVAHVGYDEEMGFTKQRCSRLGVVAVTLFETSRVEESPRLSSNRTKNSFRTSSAKQDI